MLSNKLKKSRMSLTTKEGLTGIVFLAPFIIGLIYFFLIPMISSLVYSFNLVSFGNDGLNFEFVGLQNYKEVFTTNKMFWTAFKDSVSTLLYQVPVVVIYSLFIALILNLNMPGRLLYRIVFFMPMIFMADVVYKVIASTGMDPTLSDSGNSLISLGFEIQGLLKDILSAIGLPTEIMEKLMGIINNIFQISWKAPIQIILYLTGLQAIPSSYYEVCMIEGGTKWEAFWKVTFPMLSPITLLCVVFSIVDTFTDSNSDMIYLINRTSQSFLHESMTISWCYFIFVFIYTSIVIGLISRWVKYMDD